MGHSVGIPSATQNFHYPNLSLSPENGGWSRRRSSTATAHVSFGCCCTCRRNIYSLSSLQRHSQSYTSCHRCQTGNLNWNLVFPHILIITSVCVRRYTTSLIWITQVCLIYFETYPSIANLFSVGTLQESNSMNTCFSQFRYMRIRIPCENSVKLLNLSWVFAIALVSETSCVPMFKTIYPLCPKIY